MRRAWTCWFIALASCAANGGSESVELDVLAQGFRPVSTMLGARCGSLDCHGQRSRNLRLYSGRGLRLSPDDSSGHGGTRAAEHEANLVSVVGLEPELIARVVRDHGRDPERLTLLRKATGREAHSGGTILQADDPGLKCVSGWLARDADDEACESAAMAVEREP
jgi:hypothetical protein